MNDPIERYMSLIAQIPDGLPDPWFAEQMARCRAGDEAALRQLSERCLKRVLTLAKKHWRADGPTSWLDTVQVGNAVLVKAIRECSANKAEEFLQQMTVVVERSIILFLQHPDLHG
jgi:DNA-directed RNA polymerase specialized sigma subunit